jgi:purine-nucleoside phosphorylase
VTDIAVPEARPSAFGLEEARRSADAVHARSGSTPAPEIAIVLGSGLGGLAWAIDATARVPFREIPGFPAPSVVGHAGEMILGALEGRRVIALAGRFHMYEGHDARLAAFPVRVMHALGARTLIVSNAAGAIRRDLHPGDLMLIDDHINAMWRNPLIGPIESGEERFPDMSAPYDAGLRAVAGRVAREEQIPLAEGVYAGLLGPTYETVAEVRMLERLGADVVGMSTVPEVIAARALGMRVLGISCVTNHACGIATRPLSHAEVLETTASVAGRFAALVRGVVGAAEA